jgi:hypothetical protein
MGGRGELILNEDRQESGKTFRFTCLFMKHHGVTLRSSFVKNRLALQKEIRIFGSETGDSVTTFRGTSVVESLQKRI